MVSHLRLSTRLALFLLTLVFSLLQVHFIASSTAKMLGLPPIEDSEVVLDARFNAGIYGLADEATLKAIKMVRSLFPLF